MIKGLRLITLTAAVACTALTSAAAATSVKVSLDSAAVVMGRLNGLNVEVVTRKDDNGRVVVDKEALAAMGIDLIDEDDSQTEPLGGDVVQMTRKYYLQPFDSGAYTLPSVLYISGGDTLHSNTPALKVLPVDVSHLEDINPDADVIDPDRRWYDFMPDFITDYWVWWLAGLLIIAGGICAALIFTRKIEIKLPKKAPTPPDVTAWRKLERLRESKLWENGREKEYYTRLVDILREYLHKRFGINAMEMTSTQIMHAVRNNPTANMSRQNMRDIINIADFVKFAQVRPLPDDNVQAMRAAMRFVDDTRPLPAESDDAAAGGSDRNPAHDGNGDTDTNSNKIKK